MAEDQWGSVWARVRAGRHTIIVGAGAIPPAPSDLKVLQVSCHTPWTTGGPLDEARRMVEQLLGGGLGFFDQGRKQRTQELRSQLLGDMPGRSLDAVWVEECNRLASWAEGHMVLGFETIESADEATVETLVHILQHPGWLRLPLLFTAQSVPKGPVAELVAILRREDGDDALIEVQGEAPAGEAASPFDWTLLPPDVLRVLRAGTVLGTGFEAELVARLLDEPVGTVLEKLQSAADMGAPLADRGGGRFMIPSEALEALQKRMLPSLLTFWHERLGGLLSAGRSTRDTIPPEAGIPGAPINESRGEGAVKPQAAMPTQTKRSPAAYVELFEPAGHSEKPDAESPPQAQEAAPKSSAAPWEPAKPPQARARGERRSPQSREDQARAAAHLQRAGHTEAAIEQYLAAVQEAAARGDTRRASLLDREALTLLDTLPPSNQRALLRSQLLLEMGRLQWQAAGSGTSFTLRAALGSLTAARSALPDEAPADIVSQLATVTAGVCCDLGDLTALQQALNELTDVSRRLLNAGEPTLAGRLLNDQAAVYIRVGDPVGATHLLSRSLELFEHLLRDNPDDPVAAEELAETNHLFARLPLHARIRPGREEAAYEVGLDHAHRAERTYRQFGQHRELARVWETMGRLELRRGHLAAAQERLLPVLDLQRQIGDVTGLARSTAALADLFMQAGRLEEAASLLADSVTFNFEKGSPLGLAFNRQALRALSQAAQQLPGPGTEQVQHALGEVDRRLAEAESVLGRLVLPGEGDKTR